MVNVPHPTYSQNRSHPLETEMSDFELYESRRRKREAALTPEERMIRERIVAK